MRKAVRKKDVVGRKPQGFSARSIALPAAMWARIDVYKETMHLSSAAEAVRLLLWRALDDVEAAKDSRPDEPPNE